jgi:hypothetical protein
MTGSVRCSRRQHRPGNADLRIGYRAVRTRQRGGSAHRERRQGYGIPNRPGQRVGARHRESGGGRDSRGARPHRRRTVAERRGVGSSTSAVPSRAGRNTLPRQSMVKLDRAGRHCRSAAPRRDSCRGRRRPQCRVAESRDQSGIHPGVGRVLRRPALFTAPRRGLALVLGSQRQKKCCWPANGSRPPRH